MISVIRTWDHFYNDIWYSQNAIDWTKAAAPAPYLDTAR
jgi:hypothetical protein